MGSEQKRTKPYPGKKTGIEGNSRDYIEEKHSYLIADWQGRKEIR